QCGSGLSDMMVGEDGRVAGQWSGGGEKGTRNQPPLARGRLAAPPAGKRANEEEMRAIVDWDVGGAWEASAEKAGERGGEEGNRGMRQACSGGEEWRRGCRSDPTPTSRP